MPCLAAEYKDNETGMHVVRMSHFCKIIAMASGMDLEEAEILMQAAPMHDIGKIGVPDSILLKSGKLNDAEWKIMKDHTIIGAKIMGEHSYDLLKMARTIALTQHEKWDGTGYPYGLQGEKIPFIGNITSAILTITPFFAEFIYYKNFESVIFVHAMFLFLILSMRELTKDLENIKGDLALGYKSIPIVYSEKISKVMLTGLAMLTLIPAYLLIYHYQVGRMTYFFYLSIVILLIFLILVWKSNSKSQYLLLHNILKFIIVAGVFSIVLIDINVVLTRIL